MPDPEKTGLLAELDRVSSVSGGSSTAGVLAKSWSELNAGTERERFGR